MTVKDLEEAVARLTPADLARFSRWFETFEAERFDAALEHDATNGRLDELAAIALDEFRKGRATEL